MGLVMTHGVSEVRYSVEKKLRKKRYRRKRQAHSRNGEKTVVGRGRSCHTMGSRNVAVQGHRGGKRNPPT